MASRTFVFYPLARDHYVLGAESSVADAPSMQVLQQAYHLFDDLVDFKVLLLLQFESLLRIQCVHLIPLMLKDMPVVIERYAMDLAPIVFVQVVLLRLVL